MPLNPSKGRMFKSVGCNKHLYDNVTKYRIWNIISFHPWRI